MKLIAEPFRYYLFQFILLWPVMREMIAFDYFAQLSFFYTLNNWKQFIYDANRKQNNGNTQVENLIFNLPLSCRNS